MLILMKLTREVEISLYVLTIGFIRLILVHINNAMLYYINRNYFNQTLIIKMVKNINNSSFDEEKGGKKNGNKN